MQLQQLLKIYNRIDTRSHAANDIQIHPPNQQRNPQKLHLTPFEQKRPYKISPVTHSSTDLHNRPHAVSSNLHANALFFHQNHEQFMQLDADEYSETWEEELDAQSVPIEGGQADYATQQIEYVAAHIDEKIPIIAFPFFEHKFLLLIAWIQHLTSKNAMMPPLPNLSKKQATRRNDKEDATPKIVVDPLPKEGVI